MTAGLADTRITAILNVYRAVAYSAVTPFVQVHTGDPGAAGTSNIATTSPANTRNAPTFNAPAPPSMTLSALASYTMGATETVTHISFWSASSGGTFQESWALSSGVPVVNGSTLTINTLTLTYSPRAA